MRSSAARVALVLALAQGWACQTSPGTSSTRGVRRAAEGSALEVPADSGRRVALVIGNQDYDDREARLDTPRADSSAVSELFAGLGFEVALEQDLDHSAMSRALAEFSGRLEPGDLAVLYYAGHGMQIEGRNYLLPVDFVGESAAAGELESLGLGEIIGGLDRLAKKHVGLSPVVVLDACRHNPYVARRERAEEVFAAENYGEDTAVWYSTKSLRPAVDRVNDADSHSPFGQAFLEVVGGEPNAPLFTLGSAVKRRVRGLTNGHQSPRLENNLTNDVTFTGGVLGAPQARRRQVEDAPQRTESGPRSMALVVAIEETLIEGESWRFRVDKDVARMVRAFESLELADTRVLLAEEASLSAIRVGLARLKSQARTGDVVALHLTGMGAPFVDVGLEEPDGWGECFFGHGEVAASRRNAASACLSDAELLDWIQDVRAATGPSGHVLVTIDAHEMFDSERERATLDQMPEGMSPVVVLQPGGMAYETVEAEGGALSRMISNALQNALPHSTYRQIAADVSRQLAGVGPKDFRPEVDARGQLDTEVATGRFALRAPFVKILPGLRYGAQTLYIAAGHAAGVFPGGRVVVHRAPRPESPGTPLATGTVREAGLLWARVELDAEPSESLQGAVVLPTVLALPPTGLAVSVGHRVGPRRDEVVAMLERLGVGLVASAHNAVELRGEPGYVTLMTPQGQAIGGPIATARDDFLPELERRLFQAAFAQFLLSIESSDPGTTPGVRFDTNGQARQDERSAEPSALDGPAGDEVPALRTRGLRRESTARIQSSSTSSWCGLPIPGATESAVVMGPDDAATVRAVGWGLTASSRGIMREVGVREMLDPEELLPVVAVSGPALDYQPLEFFAVPGGPIACVAQPAPGRHAVVAIATRERNPSRAFAPRLEQLGEFRVSAAAPNEVPLGVLDERTQRALAELNAVTAVRLDLTVEPAGARARSR